MRLNPYVLAAVMGVSSTAAVVGAATVLARLPRPEIMVIPIVGAFLVPRAVGVGPGLLHVATVILLLRGLHAIDIPAGEAVLPPGVYGGIMIPWLLVNVTIVGAIARRYGRPNRRPSEQRPPQDDERD